MDAVQERPATVDAVARRTLTTLVGLSGVHRAGLAVTEGGGRRLRFTSSDRDGEVVEWCYIDAYDDVPLTAVVRSGGTVAGTLHELRGRFPDFVAHQEAGPTVALMATSATTGERIVGGVVVYLDRTAALEEPLATAVLEAARAAGDDLVMAQRRVQGPATEPFDSPTAPDAVAKLHVADPADVGAARRRLHDLLDEQAVDPETVDSAVLCLSEVLTNAVMHTSAPAHVRVSVDNDVLVVSVRDAGSHLGHRPDLLEPAETLPVSGRGLQIVEALSTRWGADTDEAGTTVWFVLELTPA
jgi:anti-sigma regulatory factor (Ser/Thr protein kinase)